MDAQRRGPQGAEAALPAEHEWMRRIAHARTERELLELCAGRLASLGAADIERLPRDCRPVEIEDRADLAVYALNLVRRQNAAPSCPPPLASLAQFFALANVRMAQVLRHKDDAREADAWLSQMDRSRPRDPGSQAIE